MSTAIMDGRRRADTIDAASRETFDLLIIGGGINGAGIAHDASLRGLKVALLEMRDLAFGTSSRSSKLIHGGLRYLEHFQFRLVFEGTNERALLRKIAPHLVRPLLFALPVYEGARHPRWKVEVGMWMYDGLSLFKAEQRHIAVRSAKRLLEREPLLRSDGLTGGIIYYDCATDDARLTLENAIAAARCGAPIITRARVTKIDDLSAGKSQPVRVTFKDELSGKEHVFKAKGVVNATGVWTDNIRNAAKVESKLIRPTKGVHLVVPHHRLPVHHAAALLTPQDARVMFAIPWNGRTVLGTTDTDDRGDPAKVRVDAADVSYLLHAANYAFPSVHLTEKDIISAWAGLRPLIYEEADSASDVSREHQIFRDGRMVTIAGGKLTTYRRMAAETVDKAVEVINAHCQDSTTASAKLPGAIELEEDFESLAAKIRARHNLPEDVALRLANVYGSRAFQVAEYTERERDLAVKISPDRDVILAEAAHAVEHELALSVEDVLVRRTSLALTASDQARGGAERVAEVIGARLGWSAEQKKKSLDEYHQALELVSVFRHPTEIAPAI